ncbi:unnamed protein product, partial [Medioppia subpectinata]
SDAEPDHCLPDLSKKYNIPNLTVLSKYTYKIYTSVQQVTENVIDAEHTHYVHAHFIRGVLSTKFIITGDGTEDSPLVILIELYLFSRKATTMHLEQRACTPAYAECHIKYIGIPKVTPAMFILSGISLSSERTLVYTRFLGTPTLWNQIVLWLFHRMLTTQVRDDGLIWSNLNSPSQPIFTKNDTVIARTRRMLTKFYD